MKFLDLGADFLANSPTHFFRIAFSVVMFLGLWSCSSKADSNSLFNEKYAKDIDKIKIDRVEPQQDKKSKDGKLNFTAQIEQDMSRYTNDNSSKFPEYYSTQQFANQQPGPSAFNFPGEMFENNYSMPINSPFRKIGAEFDMIMIPSQDAYGIRAAMTEKEYLLVSRKLLQKNIDQINGQKTANDIENSQILIAEQKHLKRKQQMLKIFGQEPLTAEDGIKSEKAGKFGDSADKEKVAKKKPVIMAKMKKTAKSSDVKNNQPLQPVAADNPNLNPTLNSTDNVASVDLPTPALITTSPTN